MRPIKRILNSKIAQALLDYVLVFIAIAVFSVGITRIWTWFNVNEVKRQADYQQSRVNATNSTIVDNLYLVSKKHYGADTKAPYDLSEDWVFKGTDEGLKNIPCPDCVVYVSPEERCRRLSLGCTEKEVDEGRVPQADCIPAQDCPPRTECTSKEISSGGANKNQKFCASSSAGCTTEESIAVEVMKKEGDQCNQVIDSEGNVKTVEKTIQVFNDRCNSYLKCMCGQKAKESGERFTEEAKGLDDEADALNKEMDSIQSQARMKMNDSGPSNMLCRSANDLAYNQAELRGKAILLREKSKDINSCCNLEDNWNLNNFIITDPQSKLEQLERAEKIVRKNLNSCFRAKIEDDCNTITLPTVSRRNFYHEEETHWYKKDDQYCRTDANTNVAITEKSSLDTYINSKKEKLQKRLDGITAAKTSAEDMLSKLDGVLSAAGSTAKQWCDLYLVGGSSGYYTAGAMSGSKRLFQSYGVWWDECMKGTRAQPYCKELPGIYGPCLPNTSIMDPSCKVGDCAGFADCYNNSIPLIITPGRTWCDSRYSEYICQNFGCSDVSNLATCAAPRFGCPVGWNLNPKTGKCEYWFMSALEQDWIVPLVSPMNKYCGEPSADDAADQNTADGCKVIEAWGDVNCDENNKSSDCTIRKWRKSLKRIICFAKDSIADIKKQISLVDYLNTLTNSGGCCDQIDVTNEDLSRTEKEYKFSSPKTRQQCIDDMINKAKECVNTYSDANLQQSCINDRIKKRDDILLVDPQNPDRLNCQKYNLQEEWEECRRKFFSNPAYKASSREIKMQEELKICACKDKKVNSDGTCVAAATDAERLAAEKVVKIKYSGECEDLDVRSLEFTTCFAKATAVDKCYKDKNQCIKTYDDAIAIIDDPKNTSTATQKDAARDAAKLKMDDCLKNPTMLKDMEKCLEKVKEDYK